MSGDIGAASVRLDGTSKAYLTGNVTGGVGLAINGISTAYVQATPGKCMCTFCVAVERYLQLVKF